MIKVLYKQAIVGALLGLLIMVFFFIFDGIGISRVSGYFDYYKGSMSYSDFKIVLQPTRSLTADEAILSLRNLKYGSRLKDEFLLESKILASEVPQADISHIFYDSTVFGRLSPDSIYACWMSHRGSYFLFPFQSKTAFEITNVAAYAGDAVVDPIPEIPNWRKPYLLYAWCNLLAILLFFIAAASIADLSESKVMPFPILPWVWMALFGACISYVFIRDLPYAYDVFQPITALCLLGVYIYILLRPSKSLRTTSSS